MCLNIESVINWKEQLLFTSPTLTLLIISSVVLSSGSIKNDGCQQGSTDHLQQFNIKVLVTKNRQTSRTGDFPSRQAYTKCSVKLWNIL